jgi:hypothetical protein
VLARGFGGLCRGLAFLWKPCISLSDLAERMPAVYSIPARINAVSVWPRDLFNMETQRFQRLDLEQGTSWRNIGTFPINYSFQI